MEDGSVIRKVLHVQDIGYTFVGFRSSSAETLQEASRAIRNVPMEQYEFDAMLSAEGASVTLQEPTRYRSYAIDAYLDGSLVDRIVFSCRYS